MRTTIHSLFAPSWYHARMNELKVVILKLGTKTVWAEPSFLPEVGMQVHRLRKAGYRTLIVSSGAVAAGTNLMGERASDFPKPMLAGAGTLPLFSSWRDALMPHLLVPVPFLVTHANLHDGAESESVRANLVATLANEHTVPVVNENDLVSALEIDYWRHGLGENDKLTVALAHLLKTSVLLTCVYFGTGSGGYYTKNPASNPDAELVPRLSFSNFDVAKLIPYLNPSIAHGQTLNDIYAKLAAAYLCLHIPVPHVAIGPADGLEAFVVNHALFKGTELTL